MDSLSQLLSLPLLDFISSANTECSDELNMLLETLPDSDIQLLDNIETNNSTITETITNAITNASNDVLCRDTCSSYITDHTSPLLLALLLSEDDLKRLKDKNKNKNTVKSTVTWIKDLKLGVKREELTTNWKIYQRTS